MKVIGSQALAAYVTLPRRPVDLDVVGTYEEMLEFIGPHDKCYPTDAGRKYIIRGRAQPIEWEIAWPGSTAEMIVRLCGDRSAAPIELLLALKLSHRFKKGKHFLKTMRDIQLLRRSFAVVPDTAEYREFMARRQAEALSYAHPKLNMSKADFFSPLVPYVYDHDSVHESVKQLTRPAYQYFKPDDSEVLTSRSMFDEQPHHVKIYAVLEEAYVLALERSQIPFRGKIEPRASFLIALEKVCTSITSGWFREFAWEHYDEVLSEYRDGYVENFWDDVELGAVSLHGSTK